MVLQTMMKLVGNVATNPQAERFRSIKLTNPAIQQRVATFHGAIDFLELAGFKVHSCCSCWKCPVQFKLMGCLLAAEAG